jgi:chromosome segregation ATPase
LFTTALQAQELVMEVRNEMRTYSGGEAMAFVVDIPDVTISEAQLSFQAKLKEHTKMKVEFIDNELVFRQVIVSNLSTHPIDIFATFFEKAGFVSFSGFFYIDSAFVSNQSSEQTYHTVHKFVVDYANSAYKLGLEHKLSGETSSLADLKKEQKKNFSEQEKIQKGLINAKRQIEKSEMKITEMKTEVELLTTEIGKRKEATISSRSDAEEKKQAKSEISSMEKKRTSLNKEIDKQHNVVNQAQATIRQLEIDLKDKQRLAEILTLKISEQEQQVEGVKSKMGDEEVGGTAIW